MISKAKLQEALINMMWGAGLSPYFEGDYFEDFDMDNLVRFLEAVENTQDWTQQHDFPTAFQLGGFDRPSEVLKWFEQRRFAAANREEFQSDGGI